MSRLCAYALCEQKQVIIQIFFLLLSTYSFFTVFFVFISIKLQNLKRFVGMQVIAIAIRNNMPTFAVRSAVNVLMDTNRMHQIQHV